MFRSRDLTGIRDQIRKFLKVTPTGLEKSPQAVRVQAWKEWQRLRKKGRFSFEGMSAKEVTGQAADMRRFSDPGGLAMAANKAVQDIATQLKAETPNLAAVLTLTPPEGGVPLLAATFTFFFRRQIETKEELQRGLSIDMLQNSLKTLDTLTTRQAAGFRQLERTMQDRAEGILSQVDALFETIDQGFDALGGKVDEGFASVLDETADCRRMLNELIERGNAVKSGPFGVSGSNEQERERMVENLKRWEASKNPRRWLEGRLNGWNPSDWQKLLDKLKGSPLWPLDESELGRSLEKTRLELLADAEADERKADGRHFTNAIGMEFVFIPPGNFTMGSPNGHERPQRQVTIGNGFFMGIVPVTQEQWQKVMGGNPSGFKSLKNPVEQVCWNDCHEFLAKLREKDGWSYRLPSEAEWEYACRAGTNTAFFFGDGEQRLNEFAWFKDNSGEKTHPVGQKKSNPWGLYDILGNVLEWCEDFYGPYDKAPTDGKPQTTEHSNNCRVFRGGSWMLSSEHCRSACRTNAAPDFRVWICGLRVVFAPDAATLAYVDSQIAAKAGDPHTQKVAVEISRMMLAEAQSEDEMPHDLFGNPLPHDIFGEPLPPPKKKKSS